MNTMDEYDVIGLTIGAHGGSITGRTAIQKLIYFAKVKIPSIDVTYTHHYYGPFSRNIAIGLENLTAFSYLEERNTSGTSFESYQYGLTTSGVEIFEKTKNDHEMEYKIISEIVDTCEKNCHLKANPLSYAAKADYILREKEINKKEGTTISDIKELAEEFGWKISEDEVAEGINLLKELELVKFD